MSISAVGNVVFVNQQTASVAPLQGNQNTRFDLQNLAAQAAVNEKDEKVLEVRPAEENQEVDPDREHQKNEANQENARSEHEEEGEEEDAEVISEVHKLDIKV